MAVTRLKRKGLRNKARAKQRQAAIKVFTRLPPIKKVDVEAIKAEFAKKSGKANPPKKEAAANTSSDEPKAESKSAPKSDPAAEQKPEAKAAPKSGSASDEKASPDTTAEVREPTKGSVEDAEMVEEKIEKSEEKESPKVAPDVVSPEAGAPDETPSEADETKADKK